MKQPRPPQAASGPGVSSQQQKAEEEFESTCQMTAEIYATFHNTGSKSLSSIFQTPDLKCKIIYFLLTSISFG